MNSPKYQPLVSVMIPYYNCKPYIAEALMSIDQQTYDNIEIIVVDDGSNPEHAAYLQNYLIDKSNIQLIKQVNQGVAAARNLAAEYAKGKYFLFLDADDMILPTYIEKCVALLESQPNCKLVYPEAEFFEAQAGKWVIPEYQDFQSLLLGNKFPSSVSMHRSADYRIIGGFDESLQTHEDWDYWIRLLENNGKVHKIPEVLFLYRKRSDHSSLIDGLEQNPDQSRVDCQKIYNKNENLFIKNQLSYWDWIQYNQKLSFQLQSMQIENNTFEFLNDNFESKNSSLVTEKTSYLEQQHNDFSNEINKNKEIKIRIKQELENAQKNLAIAIEKTQNLENEKEQHKKEQEQHKKEQEQHKKEQEQLEKEKKRLEQIIDDLMSSNQDLSYHLQKEAKNLAKYKGLWTVKTLKPLVKTEQAISSANRYRKGFRLLVREKGSIGKAYQFLRKSYKHSKSIKTIKQILKASHVKDSSQIDIQPLPELLTRNVTKDANNTCALKVAIIAELSIPQCTKYRVIQKQEMLQSLDIPCSVTSWTDQDEARKQISLASVVIFYRVPGFDNVMSLIEECRRLKIKTLWDVDDLIFDEEILKKSSTINSLDKKDKEGVINGANLYRKAMLACDEGIASTSGLAKAMQEAGLKNVYVIENALDKETLNKVKSIRNYHSNKDNLIRIIYGSGTKTHNIDFMEAAPALAETLRKNPNVIFRYVGFLELPEYFTDIKDQIEHIPFCSYTEYLGHLADCDISIAPLENFIFNDSKSNIKYLEASITGLASICSPRAAFSSVIIHGKTGMLADSKEEWLIAFDKLIKDSDLRKDIAAAAYENVMARYSPQHIGEQLGKYLQFNTFSQRNKTRILTFNVYYAPQSFGGATIVAEQINKLLVKDGQYEVYAVTTLPTTYLKAYSVVRYEYNNVTVFGIAVPPEESANYSNPKFNLVVEEIIKLIKPDIAHIHCIQGIGVEVIESCRSNGIKTIATLHDAWWICPNQFMLDEHNKFKEDWDPEDFPERHRIVGGSLQNLDMVVTPSQYFTDLHIKIAERDVYTNKNGVMKPINQIKKSKSDVLRFGYVGGMTEIKGVHLILESFKKYNFPDTELIVVDNMLNMGSQSFYDEQFKGISSYRIVPAYNQKNIDDFFNGIDVLLFPTQWKESFGLTVREAILRNVWVIATDAGGVSEDIIEGENGTIIPFDSGVEELSEAIKKVCLHYESISQDDIIDLPKSHIRSFEEQKDELTKMYQQLLTLDG